MNRLGLATVLWCVLLMVAVVAVTVAAFLTLVIPEQRGASFWIALVTGCLGEVVAFAYLPYLLLARHTTARPSPAVRMRVMMLIVFWVVFLLVTGAFAAAPAYQDTFFSDKILLWQLVASLALLVGAYLLSRQDVAGQTRHSGPQQERMTLQAYAVGIDPLVTAVRGLTRQHPGETVELDRLAKKLDTLKSHLLSISPAANRDADRLVDPASGEDIEAGLRNLHRGVAQLQSAGAAEAPAQLARVAQLAEAAIAAIRHRDSTLSF